MALRPLKVITFNMHKGMSALNRHVQLDAIACALAAQVPDLVFLQEVSGENSRADHKHTGWPVLPQHHFLAHRLNLLATYGRNADTRRGHHGNALLTRFPLASWRNIDISVNARERRGLLHARLQPEGWPLPVDTLCVHLNLLGHDRSKQYATLVEYILHATDPALPLILAGDFNDWRGQANHCLCRQTGLVEVHHQLFGGHARSFPARLPVLRLDRIYVRGLVPVAAAVLRQSPWPSLSDHLPLSAILRLEPV